MVKFSKELEAQLIPEWKQAFVNYWQLKRNVKKIKLCRKQDTQEHRQWTSSLLNSIRCFAGFLHGDDRSKAQKRTREADNRIRRHLDQLFYEEDEVNEFYVRLEEELKKVNNFYEEKELEFLERGEILNKQLQNLLELKQILQERRARGGFERSESVRSGFSDNMAEPNVVIISEKEDIGFTGSKLTKKDKRKPKTMRIDIPATTPMHTIAAIMSMLREDLLSSPEKINSSSYVNWKKIHRAEKMIRGAFIELYKGLRLLEIYRSLNMVALRKILKKFDKVAKQQASQRYSKEVKRSHFMSSDKVIRLSEEVESIFTEHFAENRKKAMQFLRPQPHKASHMITFLVGLFTGCSITLFIVYIILTRFYSMFSATTKGGDMDIVYAVFSMFALFSLHIFLYGCNLFVWRSTRINYSFIFEFSPSGSLRHRDAFLISSSLISMVVATMVIHIILRSNGFSPHQLDAIPGILFLLFLALLFCPINIFYRSSRNCFLRAIWRILCSPLYKVVMVDFFMADQLTSQVPLLRHLEFAACYFIGGSRRQGYEICTASSKRYKQIAYLVSFTPYYCRAMQCARRWYDEDDMNHIANLGKYVSAMLAAGARLTYSMRPTPLWFGLAIFTSALATIYQLYWDFVKDWGLLNRKSKNPWLRDDLILSHKSVYFVSMGLNLLLRLAWIESVMAPTIRTHNGHLLDFFLASLEIIRRGHWNFYRLENEHLNNVGKFRAVKTVPLPFNEMYFDD